MCENVFVLTAAAVWSSLSADDPTSTDRTTPNRTRAGTDSAAAERSTRTTSTGDHPTAETKKSSGSKINNTSESLSECDAIGVRNET